MPDRKQTRWMKLRLLVVVCMLVAFGSVLLVRIWTLQVVQSEWLEGLAREQYLKEISLESTRGPILDRNNTPLALSVMADSIFGSPAQIKDPLATTGKLARILSLDSSRLYKKLISEKHFVWIKRRVTPTEAKRVRELDLDGVSFTRESRRYYPARELAGSVVGFAGDGRGLEGIELMFDGQLRGATVLAQGIRDARGNLLFAEGVGDQDVSQGGGIVLSIDLTIQEIVETELMRTVSESQARAATAIVMVPNTGEILAMANLPTFNPNTFWKFSADRWRNRAVTDCFEPGSTFKVFTMAIGLQDRQVNLSERIDCQNGELEVGGHVIHDSTVKSRGWLTPKDILVTSSNIGIAQIGLRMGKERLDNGLRRFGFGKRVGVELPGELGCVLRKARSTVGVATISFGQGVSVTPLQLVVALGSVANGGVWMRPMVVKEIRGPKGDVWKRFEPEPAGRVLEASVSKKLTKMMIGVTEPDGTGYLAAVEGFKVAGKTGTAQKADPIAGGYFRSKSIASFMGFVPAYNPRIAVLVLVDEPSTSSFGGVVAAPAFSRIAEATLRYLKVFPSDPDSLVAVRQRTRSNVQDAPNNPSVTFIEPIDQNPAGIKGQIPDVRGVSVRRALKMLSVYELDVEVKGSGRVMAQEPAPATIVSSSAKVSLILERD